MKLIILLSSTSHKHREGRNEAIRNKIFGDWEAADDLRSFFRLLISKIYSQPQNVILFTK